MDNVWIAIVNKETGIVRDIGTNISVYTPVGEEPKYMEVEFDSTDPEYTHGLMVNPFIYKYTDGSFSVDEVTKTEVEVAKAEYKSPQEQMEMMRNAVDMLIVDSLRQKHPASTLEENFELDSLVEMVADRVIEKMNRVQIEGRK